MRLHDLKLLGGKAAWLAQYGVRNGNLPNVMHNCGQRNMFNFLRRKIFAQRRIFKEQLSDVMYFPDVLTGLATAKFNGC